MGAFLIDFISFQEDTLDDLDFQKRLAKTMKIEFDSFFESAQKDIPERNIIGIQKSSHKLKSTLGVIQIPKLQEKVLAIETLAKTKDDLYSISLLINECKMIYNKALMELTEYFNISDIT